jgi:hypothetical protein
MEIKGKAEKLLVKQHNACKRNVQELTHYIKNQNCESWALKKEKRYKQKGL